MEQPIIVDLSPVVEYLLEILMAALAAAIGVLVPFLLKKIGLEISEKHREAIQGNIWAALNHATEKLRVDAASMAVFETRNQVVMEAGNYLIKSFPDAVKHFKMTPERVHEMIAARLEFIDPPKLD